MSPSNEGMPRLPRAIREASPADALATAAIALGLLLVVFGTVLEERSGVELGVTIRALGGLILLGGIGVIAFWEPRRRAIVIGWARRLVASYLAATAAADWRDRVGLAGVLVGVALLPPAVVAQFLFGSPFGVLIIAPGIVSFWGGLFLFVYGRFRRRAGRRASNPLAERGAAG